MTTKTTSPLARPRIWIPAGMLLLVVVVFFWLRQSREVVSAPASVPPLPADSPRGAPSKRIGVTSIYAHNLRLHQGPNFQVYVRWLKGQMVPAKKGVNPSFDDPGSFYLDVTNGVIRANLGDICNYLNAKTGKSPFREIRMTGNGDQVKITGKLHKLVTLPVELDGVVKPAGDHTIQMHFNKINVLKIPFKAMLGGLHVTLASLMGSEAITGMKVDGNDIYFDCEQLLPPPHIRGRLTRVSFASPDLEAMYGDAEQDVERVEQWRNFLRLRDGTIEFGKLTMNSVDLMMIDISQDAWFDLDLANYQAQLVNGYTRMTPEAGLQIFMPDVSHLKEGRAKEISIEWFKNRNLAPPAAVVPQNR